MAADRLTDAKTLWPLLRNIQRFNTYKSKTALCLPALMGWDGVFLVSFFFFNRITIYYLHYLTGFHIYKL